MPPTCLPELLQKGRLHFCVLEPLLFKLGQTKTKHRTKMLKFEAIVNRILFRQLCFSSCARQTSECFHAKFIDQSCTHSNACAECQKNRGCFVIKVTNDDNTKIELIFAHFFIDTRKAGPFCADTQTTFVGKGDRVMMSSGCSGERLKLLSADWKIQQILRFFIPCDSCVYCAEYGKRQ